MFLSAALPVRLLPVGGHSPCGGKRASRRDRRPRHNVLPTGHYPCGENVLRTGVAAPQAQHPLGIRPCQWQESKTDARTASTPCGGTTRAGKTPSRRGSSRAGDKNKKTNARTASTGGGGSATGTTPSGDQVVPMARIKKLTPLRQ